MNSRVLLAAFVGAILSFLFGWLIYGFLLAGYFAEYSIVKYFIGLEKMPPNLLGIFLSSFAYTLLMAIIFGNWANITTVRNGAIAGFTISLLMMLSFDLNLWSTLNLYGKRVILADVLVNAATGAIIGAVIAWILGYQKKE